MRWVRSGFGRVCGEGRFAVICFEGTAGRKGAERGGGLVLLQGLGLGEFRCL